MKILSNSLLALPVILFFGTFLKAGEHQKEHQKIVTEPSNVYVIPVKYNTMSNQWEALVSFSAIIIRGEMSLKGPRYWEPFAISKTTGESIIQKIQNDFKNYGLSISQNILANLQQKRVDGKTYYFVQIPFTLETRGQVLYDAIQKHNSKLKAAIEAKRRNDQSTLAKLNLTPTMLRLASSTGTVYSIVDVKWIPIEEIISAPQSKNWGASEQYNHEVDPQLKDILRTYWPSLQINFSSRSN